MSEDGDSGQENGTGKRMGRAREWDGQENGTGKRMGRAREWDQNDLRLSEEETLKGGLRCSSPRWAAGRKRSPAAIDYQPM
jgi:hypothetical protein